MSTSTRQPDSLSHRGDSRAHAARFLDVALERVEVLTGHPDFTSAIIARIGLMHRDVPAPEPVRIEAIQTPAGERHEWMLVAVLPEPASPGLYPVHATLPLRADFDRELRNATPVAA